MTTPVGGVQVTVTYRAEILLGFMTEKGSIKLLLDQEGAELLIDALNDACAAAREVQHLGEAADQAAGGEEN